MLKFFKIGSFLSCFLVLASSLVASPGFQEGGQGQSLDSLIYSIEDQILLADIDSAKAIIGTLNTSDNYMLTLSAIVENKATFKHLHSFIASVIKRPGTEALEVDRFLSENLTAPEGRFDLDYVWVKWWRIENAGNRLLDVELAGRLHEELRNYLSQFSEKTDDFGRAEILRDIHTMLFLTIERKGQELYDMALEVEKKAKALSDTTLLTMTYKGKCNGAFYVKGIEEYIEIAKEAVELDYVRAPANRGPYYTENLLMLTSAMIFKRGEEALVYEYIDRLYEAPLSRATSYITYLQLLQKLGPDHEIRTKIYKKFGVANSPELIAYFEKDAEKTTHVLNKSHVAKESAILMIREGEAKLAIRKLASAIRFTQQAYSTDLSEALAKYESGLVREQKDKELAIERLQNRNTLIIAIVGFLLFIAVAVAFYNQRKHNRTLGKKNTLIQNQNEQKELLLKEIHHRVKNNLQVISSLLELQSFGIEDEKALSTFTEGQNRVKAMALIHQKLYQNENLATIDFGEYAEQLSQDLAGIYPNAGKVTTSVNAESKIRFDIDTAVPLGLILNELISNSYKYAFEGKDKGEIQVSIESIGDGKHQLMVEDNGRGLSKGFDLEKAKSLGLRLVNRLTEQLYGTVDYYGDHGAKFVINFEESIRRNPS